MDASTVQFHRELLRHLKGALKSYQRWIDEEAQDLTVESLKRKKSALANAPLESTEKVG